MTTTEATPARRIAVDDALAAVSRHPELTLVVGQTLKIKADSRAVCGGCLLTILAIDEGMEVRWTTSIRQVVEHLGLEQSYVFGVIDGFDLGSRIYLGAGAGYVAGHTLGRACRVALADRFTRESTP